MRTLTTTIYRLTASAALSLIAGCAGGGSQLTAATPGSVASNAATNWIVSGPNIRRADGRTVNAAKSATEPIDMQLKPAAISGDIYIAYFGSGPGFVDYYRRGEKDQVPSGQLLGPKGAQLLFPLGVTTDRAGNIYVCEYGASRVDMYAPGAMTPTKTLDDPNGEPYEDAVGSDGTLYVSNFGMLDNSTPTIVAYAPGSKRVTATYKDDHATFNSGVAVDKSKNLYVSYSTSGSFGPGTIAVFPTGSQVPVETGVTLGDPGGMGIDSSGHVLATDQEGPNNVQAINVYSPSKPVGSLTQTRTLDFDRGDPTYFTLGEFGRLIYVDDFGFGGIDVFRYSDLKLMKHIPAPGSVATAGVAVFPSFIP